MDTRPFDEVLKRTLDDGRLSRSEERALRAVVAELGTDGRRRALLRSRVFEIAHEHAPDRRVVGALLDWLKGVLNAMEPDEAPDGPAPLEVVFSPGDDCLNRIRSLIDGARSSVDVCVFTLTDDRIAGPLLRAHGRGVKVRILTDDDKSEDLGSDVARLAEQGVPVRMDRSPCHMHHKFAVFDRQTVLTGSYNWTRAAARENEENIVVLGDPRAVKAFSVEFEDLWRRFG